MRTFAEFQIIGRVGKVKDVGTTLRISIASEYGRKDEGGLQDEPLLERGHDLQREGHQVGQGQHRPWRPGPHTRHPAPDRVGKGRPDRLRHDHRRQRLRPSGQETGRRRGDLITGRGGPGRPFPSGPSGRQPNLAARAMSTRCWTLHTSDVPAMFRIYSAPHLPPQADRRHGLPGPCQDRCSGPRVRPVDPRSSHLAPVEPRVRELRATCGRSPRGKRGRVLFSRRRGHAGFRPCFSRPRPC